jgi:hypothetical protein
MRRLDGALDRAGVSQREMRKRCQATALQILSPAKASPMSFSSTRSVAMNLARRFNAGNGQWRNDARRVSDD